jgi:hypothetical protein
LKAKLARSIISVFAKPATVSAMPLVPATDSVPRVPANDVSPEMMPPDETISVPPAMTVVFETLPRVSTVPPATNYLSALSRSNYM